MIAWHPIWLLRTVQFLGVASLILCWGQADILLVVLFTFLIAICGQGIGQHRYFSHKSFKTDDIKHKFLAILATLSTSGSILHWSAVHRYHHENADTDKDIHNPKILGYFKTFFMLYNPVNIPKSFTVKLRDLLKDPVVMFTHNYYWFIILSYIIFLAILGPTYLVSCYLIPVGFARLSGGIQSAFTHGLMGYRNFDIKDKSTNHTLCNYITFGEGLHNNHHKYPGKYSFVSHPAEIDPTGWIIEKLWRK